jgi:tripartite-type tricarboxylate transporter receptor subunit TctC
MVTNPSVPAKTVPEFIVYAKTNPGRISMASAGSGTPAHVSGELFKMITGVSMVHVPYRGAGPALVDLVGGQVQVMFPTMSSSIEYVRAGKLRALAVTTATRSEVLPQIPTVGDFVPGFEATFWTGVGAPKNTPAEIVDKLNKEINAGLADPTIKASRQGRDWAMSTLRCSPTRNCLLATGERFCDLASSFDEELRHRAEGPILQGHNSDRPTGNRQFDRQFPDEWMRVWQL